MNKMPIKGYENLRNFVSNINKNEQKQIILLFLGEKNSAGVSWCPDCVRAEPIIRQSFEAHGSKHSVLVEVDVGDKTYWRDMNNPFRKDPVLKLKEIPTLIRWHSAMRLEGAYCEKSDILEMFFSEEED